MLHQPATKNCRAFFAAGFSWNSSENGFCRKWTPLPRKSVETRNTVPVVCFFRDLSVTNLPQSSALTPQIYEGSYWTKQRSESQVTSQTQGSEMLYFFWHTLLHCFNTVSLWVKVQYSSWMLLGARGDVEVENEASFCWQERIGVMSSTSKLLCLWFNHWISPTWHLLILIASSSGHWNSVGLRRFAQGVRNLAGDIFDRLATLTHLEARHGL